MNMITLRKLEPSDLPFLYQWENDASSWTDGDTHNPLSQQDLRDYIESTTGDIYRDGQLRLIITEGDATLGCIDLFDFDARNRKAALGMYVVPEARGKGVGERALKRIEEYAFQYLHLRLLYAIISEHNEPCNALYRKAGYTPSSPLPHWTLEAAAVIYTKCNE